MRSVFDLPCLLVWCALVWVAPLLVASHLSGQPLTRGERVRIFTIDPDARIEGRITHQDPSTVAIQTGEGPVHTLRRENIALVERASRRGNGGVGALLGATVGAVVGLSLRHSTEPPPARASASRSSRDGRSGRWPRSPARWRAA